MSIISHFPANYLSWYFIIVKLYVNTLHDEHQQAGHFEGYNLPDLCRSHTMQAHDLSLQELSYVSI